MQCPNLVVNVVKEFRNPLSHPLKHKIMWQSQVENEHYSTVSGLIRLECFIEITPDFLCPFINDCT